MAGNTIGQLFKVTTYGESHGPALGVVIDGMLPNINVDSDLIKKELERRKPGQSNITTQRNEAEVFEILSGVIEGVTTGTPISVLIRNQNQRSKDYDHLKEIYRPSHADYTYQQKYGIRDVNGGGRASARETAARVIAGAFAKMQLKQQGIIVQAYVSKVGKIQLETEYQNLDLTKVEENVIKCPDAKIAKEMIELVETVRKNGDSIGGVITGVIQNCPVGLGEPVFDKLHADLGKAMLSINAVKGFEYGSGFEGTNLLGSEHNDAFESNDGNIQTKTNRSGGIQGGISNGMDIYFKVAFKPTATIMQNQASIDARGNEVVVKGKGRHDPCVLPRAVPIVEAMASITLADHWLRNKVYIK